MTRAEGKRPGLDRGASLEGDAPMTRTTTSRPRMAATYAPGTVRARRWHGEGDVRGYRPPSGWCGCWYQLDTVPVRTGHGAGAGQVAGVQSSGMSAFDCGFNGSMQRFVEIVRPAFHGLASSGDDRSTLATASSLACDIGDRSIPLGKYRRSTPLVFFGTAADSGRCQPDSINAPDPLPRSSHAATVAALRM